MGAASNGEEWQGVPRLRLGCALVAVVQAADL
jgi:hypothetical protein